MLAHERAHLAPIQSCKGFPVLNEFQIKSEVLPNLRRADQPAADLRGISRIGTNGWSRFR